MMTFNEFKKSVAVSIPAYLPEQYKRVKIVSIPKLNGVNKDGLLIENNHNRISPVIYLEPFYEKYNSGMTFGDTLLEITKEFYDTLESSKENIAQFKNKLNFEKMRNKIIPKLINASANKELLEQLPHRVIADLAVIYKINIELTKGLRSSANITKPILDAYNLTIDELHHLAIQNMENNFKMKLTGLMQQITESIALSNDQNPMDFDKLENPVDEPIKILSLLDYSSGASAVLSEKIMNTVIERMGKDFYILPSSLMEVLIIPNDMFKVSEMKEIVKTVNIETVKKEDFLSNEVYVYNAESKEIELADF